MPNFADNQRQWDTNPSLAMCYRKGQEHAAYGWARFKSPHLSKEQLAEYDRGYDDYKQGEQP